MIEKVSPSHPDKIADRIAGAIVDLAYKIEENPKIAVEILIGHEHCYATIETSVDLDKNDVFKTIYRITGNKQIRIDILKAPQDNELARNQNEKIRCGDNGIFKGTPLTSNEVLISKLARDIYNEFPYDGKYILTDEKFIVCQSNATNDDLLKFCPTNRQSIINPLGYWTGGLDVDSGATNRKLGSDMAQSVTGGGLHGKDLSKADVSVNIYAFLKAQETGEVQEFTCAIGDEYIDGKPYSEIVEIARDYINKIGGFEKFAEWGLF